MYEEGKTKWFSQTLLTYKDKRYASDGYMRISLVTNTEDFKFFNPPSFSISVSNTYQKTCNLSYSDVIDLMQSFEKVLTSSGEDNEVVKNIRDTRLYFSFTTAQEDRVVKMILQNSSTDLTTVVFPLTPTFQAFINVLKYFRESFPNICKELLMQTINSESTSIIHQIPSLIKGISSQIISNNYPDNSATSPAPPVEMIEKTEQTINDLDNFMGPDMENVKIAEIEEGKIEPKETVSEVESVFVDKVLKNNLYNLETLLDSVKLSDDPWTSFGSEVMNRLEPEENFTLVPTLTAADLNSLSYISKLIFSLTNMGYRTLGNVIPSGFPVLKYKVEKHDDLNREIAFDLLLFNGFLRTYRRKIESKDSVADSNGAFLYLMFRCFTDPYSFSILEVCDKTSIKSVLLNRYKYYDGLGVFDHYKRKVEEYNCPPIQVSDIDTFIGEVQSKILGETPYIDQFHKEEYAKGQFKLPYEGNFNSEQIINKIVPVEVAIKLGDKVADACKAHEVEDDIKKLFSDGQPKRQPKVKTETNLERFVRGDILSEIPEQYRTDFQKYVKELGTKNFIFDDKFPYAEFGDEIVKALYVWKPEDDEKISNNFAYFTKQYAEVIHTKESILTGNKQEAESTSGWDDIKF